MKKFIVIAVVLSLVGSASAVSPGDVVVGYDFETVVGSSVDDWSSNNLDGTLVDNATTVYNAARGSDVLSLDGIDDWLDAGNSTLYDLTDNMTVLGWAYIIEKEDNVHETGVSYGWQTIAAKGDAAGWRVQYNQDQPWAAFQWPTSTGIGNSYGTHDGEGSWHHYAAVKSGNNYDLYVDGDLLATSSDGGVPKTNTESLLIGANPELGNPPVPDNDDPWRELYGYVDDFALLDKALSEAEIEYIMNYGIPEPTTIALLGLGALALIRKRR